MTPEVDRGQALQQEVLQQEVLQQETLQQEARQEGMRIGIDLGGTKIEGVLMDAQGTILHRYREDTPQGQYQATLAQIAELVFRLERQTDLPVRVGIGTPGKICRDTGLMKNSNSVCLNHQPFLQDLQTLLGRPLSIANDANCFVLSEAMDGAARAGQVVFGVILGTGVGGGIVVNRKPLEGPNGIAGEWGHNPLPEQAPRADKTKRRACYCGRQDCIETYLSGPGLARTYHQLSGLQLTAKAVVEASLKGNDEAMQAVDLYIEQLSCALATVINVLDPDIIVLGGGLSNIELLYQRVPAQWLPYVFAEQTHTQLVAPQYGDASGVRGAAWL